jgi:hypothetical protein
LDTLSTDVEKLKLENSILQKFVDKKSVEFGKDEEDKRRKRNKKAMTALLTAEQKYDISNIIYQDTTLEIENNRKKSEKMVDTLRSVLEETEIRIGELKRDAYEFKRDVVVGAESDRNGKIIAERVIRYFEEKFKTTDAYIEKLRLKNASLKSQINKIEHQLQQKEESGDALHYIDFHQLQIENKNFLTKIEERNFEVASLKVSTGKTSQILNEYKKKLSEKIDEAEWLKNEVKNKKAYLEKFQLESSRVKKEAKNELHSRDRLRMHIEETVEMPNVEDYIMQKKELYELESTLKNWKKKVEIMEIAAKRAKSGQLTPNLMKKH